MSCKTIDFLLNMKSIYTLFNATRMLTKLLLSRNAIKEMNSCAFTSKIDFFSLSADTFSSPTANETTGFRTNTKSRMENNISHSYCIDIFYAFKSLFFTNITCFIYTDSKNNTWCSRYLRWEEASFNINW